MKPYFPGKTSRRKRHKKQEQKKQAKNQRGYAPLVFTLFLQIFLLVTFVPWVFPESMVSIPIYI